MKKFLVSFLTTILFFNINLVNLSNATDFTIIAEDEQAGVSTSFSLTTTDVRTNESTSEDISSAVEDTVQAASVSDNLYVETEPYFPSSTYEYVSPSAVFGSDDRTAVSNTTRPYCTVCYMYAEFEDGYTARGSAFMVAPNVAVTAGHMVDDEDHGGITYATVSPGRSGSSYPYGTANVTNYTRPTVWKESHSRSYDWAVIILDDNIGYSSGWVGYRYYHDYSACVGLEVEVCGYPKTVTGYSASQYKPYASSGEITSANDYILYFTIDTSGGNSGGPIFQDDDKYVVGVCTAESSSTNLRI